MTAAELHCWQNFEMNRDEKSRHSLFQTYYQWACLETRQWQRKLFVAGLEAADFTQYAAIGLLEAIDSFDSKLEIEFVHFARFRIKGAILNEAFKFSERSSQLAAIRRAKFTCNSDIEKTLNPLDTLILHIEQMATGFLLQDAAQENPRQWLMGRQYCSAEFSLLKARLLQQLIFLDEPTQSLMILHYQLDWSFQQIADELSLSKGRISQLHKAALEQIQQQISVKSRVKVKALSQSNELSIV